MSSGSALAVWVLAGVLAARTVPEGGAGNSVPVVVTPPAEGVGGDSLMAVIVSADGDWSRADEVIADSLRAHGIPSVGLKARSWLRGGRTPGELASDLESIARSYLDLWSRRGIVFVGYSRGAEIGPFGLSRWPSDLRNRLRLVALLSPGRSANFRFHAIDLVRDVRRPDDLPVLPEVEKLEGSAIVCIWGVKDRDSVCPDAPDGLVTKRPWPGGHRIGGSPVPVRMLLDELQTHGLLAR